MAIVKMKKLRLAVMASDRKALLRDLLLLGCVEVSEPSELEGGEFESLTRCSSGELSSEPGGSGGDYGRAEAYGQVCAGEGRAAEAAA